jgi:hypothetical protein
VGLTEAALVATAGLGAGFFGLGYLPGGGHLGCSGA